MEIRIDSVYSLNIKSASPYTKAKTRSRTSALESKQYDSLLDTYCVVSLERIDIGKRKHISYSKWMKSHIHCDSECFKKKSRKTPLSDSRNSREDNTADNRITRSVRKRENELQQDSCVNEPLLKRKKDDKCNDFQTNVLCGTNGENSLQTNLCESTRTNIKKEPKDESVSCTSSTMQSRVQQKRPSSESRIKVKEEPSSAKSSFDEICKVIASAPKEEKASYIEKLKSILGTEDIDVQEISNETGKNKTTDQQNNSSTIIKKTTAPATVQRPTPASGSLASPMNVLVPNQPKAIVAKPFTQQENDQTKTDANESKRIASFQTFMADGKFFMVQKDANTINKQDQSIIKSPQTMTLGNSLASKPSSKEITSPIIKHISDIVLKYGGQEVVNKPAKVPIPPEKASSASQKNEIHGHLITHPDGKQYFIPLASGQTFPSKPTLNIEPVRFEKSCPVNIPSNDSTGFLKAQSNMLEPVIPLTPGPRSNSTGGQLIQSPSINMVPLQKGNGVEQQKIQYKPAPGTNQIIPLPKNSVKSTETEKLKHNVQGITVSTMPKNVQNLVNTSPSVSISTVTSSTGPTGKTTSSTIVNDKQVIVPLLMNGAVQNVLLNVLPNGNFVFPTTNSVTPQSEAKVMINNQDIKSTSNAQAGQVFSKPDSSIQQGQVLNAPTKSVQLPQVLNTSTNIVQAGTTYNKSTSNATTGLVLNAPTNTVQTLQVLNAPATPAQPQVLNSQNRIIQSGQVLNASTNTVQSTQVLNGSTQYVQAGHVLHLPTNNVHTGQVLNTGFQLQNPPNSIIPLQNQFQGQLGSFNVLPSGSSQVQNTGQILNINPFLGQIPINNMNTSGQILQSGQVISGGIFNPLLQVVPLLNQLKPTSQANIIGNAQSQNQLLLNGQLIPVNLPTGQLQTMNNINISTLQQNPAGQIVSMAPSIVFPQGMQIKVENSGNASMLQSNFSTSAALPMSSSHVIRTSLPLSTSQPNITSSLLSQQNNFNSATIVTTTASMVLQSVANQGLGGKIEPMNSSTSVSSVFTQPLSHTKVTKPTILSTKRRSYSPSQLYKNVTKSKNYKDQIEENVKDLRQSSDNIPVPMFLKSATGQILQFSAVKPNSEPNSQENVGNLVASLLTTNSGGQMYSRNMAPPRPVLATNPSSQNPTGSSTWSQQSVPRFVPAQGYLKTQSSSHQDITKSHPIIQKSLQTLGEIKSSTLNDQSKRNKRKPEFVVRIDQDSKSNSNVEFIEIEDEDSSQDEDYSIFNIVSSSSNTKAALPMPVNSSSGILSVIGHDKSATTKSNVAVPVALGETSPRIASLSRSIEASSKSIVEKGLRIPDSMLKDLEKKQLSVESTVQKLKLSKQVI